MMHFLQDPKESNALQIEIEELKLAINESGEQPTKSIYKYQTVTSDFFRNYDESTHSHKY